MTINRRRALQLLAATGTAAMLPSMRGAAQPAARFSNPVKIPPLLTGTQAGATKTFDLDVRAGRTEFFEGLSTPTIGVNGSYLGPTLRLAAGDQVALNVTNKLAEPTTVHWHGLHVPAKDDGGPHQVIAPGTTWRPSFAIKQKASMCWYHAHLMGHTGEQVLRGLAGLIQIEDDEARALGLPSEYGVDDIPLVVQDRRFGPDGSFQYIGAMHDRMMGYMGDTLLVNGTANAHLTLRRQRTRLRVLNGSNARFYNLGRQDGRELVVIASDGSLLPEPVRMKHVRLAPGERVEILVDAEPQSSIVLMSFAGETAGGGMMAGEMMMQSAGTFPIIELRAGKLEASPTTLPQRLATSLPQWTTASAQRTRTFTLDMGMMGGMGMRMGGGMGMGRGMMMGRGMGMMGGMTINGRAMDLSRIDERVPLGAIEIWQIENPTPLAHPFHIHDIQFRVLDRDGQPPLPHERGLKDTVIVDPGTRVRVIAEFADYADAKLPYMYHCHILEHEDAGMMGQFIVV
jgi:FtsP/CotA-like multicopper oxidase with cupredoxin domain